MNRYKEKVYSWDILNEVFPDGVSTGGDWKTKLRKEAISSQGQAKNAWWYATGADYVYEGFKAARLAAPNVILYYNDYNMDNDAKSTVVADMISDVNAQWKIDSANTDKTRLLIEGIGMPSHHNTSVSKEAIQKSLNKFKALGLKISISELDVLCGSYNSAFEGKNKAPPSSLTNQNKLDAANKYYDYFQLFLQYPEIERVTFWGLFDYGSWRSGGLPLPFEGVSATSDNPTNIRAKPAYYRLIGALN
jgi:endo-1,4-beta-xylanase